MTRHLTFDEVIALHALAIDAFGGSPGLRDRGLLESAVAAPHAQFGEIELHPTVPAKAAALGFALIANHAFVDGNKRVGFVAMSTFLEMNGWTHRCETNESYDIICRVAAGRMSREDFATWVDAICEPKASG